MRALILIAVFLASCAFATDYLAMFKQFKKDYNRHYATAEEEDMRYETFVHNMLVAEGIQSQNPLAKFGVNNFADLTVQEFTSLYRNGKKFYANYNATNYINTDKLASSAGTSIDWRTKGAVTAVKNQGSCGSCWSFSATGNIEGQWAIQKGSLVSLSEQQLVSCDTTDYACDGGLMDTAFTWLIKKRNGQIFTEASYPYVSGNGAVPACSTTGKTVGATITSFKDIAKNEVTIADYLYANGPLSVAVDATSWQTYQSGILTTCVASQINHGVLLVGFSDTSVPAYWIIKNSWGTTWGEAGYIRIRKGYNTCLIREAVSTSIV